MHIRRSMGNGRMHDVVEYGNMVYIAGKTADQGIEGIAEQTRNVLQKVEERLSAGGSDKNHILRATIYLKTMDDFAGMNAVWDAWVEKEHAPARATVEARLSRDEELVEIVVDAVKKP